MSLQAVLVHTGSVDLAVELAQALARHVYELSAHILGILRVCRLHCACAALSCHGVCEDPLRDMYYRMHADCVSTAWQR